MATTSTLPKISTTSPIDGAANVLLTQNITITYSDSVRASSGIIEIRIGSPTGPLFESFQTGQYGFKTLTIDPTNNFSYNTNYYVVIPNGFFTDYQTGTAIVGTTTYDFTTQKDYKAPIIIDFSPYAYNPAIDVGVARNILINFDETILRGKGNIEIRSGSTTGPIFEIFDSAVSQRITISGSTVSIDPTMNFNFGEKYYVVIPQGSFKDIAENNFSGTSYQFLTSKENHPFLKWEKLVGETGNQTIQAAKIKDDFFYLLGDTDSNFNGVTIKGRNECFIEKYDASGNKIWSIAEGSNGIDAARDIAIDKDSNIYALTIQNNNGIFSKFDKNGIRQWSINEALNSGGIVHCNAISISNDNSIYVTGETQSPNGDADIYLRKYNDSGEKIWTTLINGNSSDLVEDIEISQDGFIYIAGSTRSNFEGKIEDGGKTDAFVSKLDSNGNLIWTKVLGSNNWDGANAITTAEDGSIYVGGYTWGSLTNRINNGLPDGFLAKYDANGSLIWSKTLGSYTTDYINDLAIDQNGLIWAVGFTDGTSLDFSNNPGPDNGDAFIATFNKDGEILWLKKEGSRAQDSAKAVAVDSGNVAYVFGHSSGNFEGIKNNGYDVFISAIGNYSPSGEVKINGMPIQGQTLTVNNLLVDSDGLGEITYTWKFGKSNLATGNTYTLGPSDVGKNISVIASYTDNYGTLELVSSLATKSIENINDIPTGSVEIEGIARPGKTLAAVNSLADADGLGEISYTWKSGLEILGTGSTYVLSEIDGGRSIYVTASYTDNFAVTESVSSVNVKVIDAVTSLISYTLKGDESTLILEGASSINGTGNSLNNKITGNSAVNILSGMDGNDLLIGAGGSDILDGGSGSDTADFSDKSSSLTITLNAGRSTVTVDGEKDTLISIENLTGGSGSDKLTGDSVANVLAGGSGNDILKGGAGSDTIEGGDGSDTADFSDKTIALTITLNSSSTSVRIGNETDTLVSIENLIGGSGNDTITGDASTNILNGGSGNDVLISGGGDDQLIGGIGNDTYIISGASSVQIVESTNQGTDTVQVNQDFSLASISNIENLTLTGTAAQGTGNNLNNSINGNSQDNQLDGGAGNDNLFGGAGNDVLMGGSGNDTLIGGRGDDIYFIDNAGDRVSESINQGIDTVRTTLAKCALATNFENLTYTGSNSFSGTGNTFANILTGGSGNDVLAGGDGIDTFNITAGTDTISDLGLGGSDIFIVSSGATANISVAKAWAASNNSINNGTTNITTKGFGINLSAIESGAGFTVTNTGNATRINGSQFADILIGGAGNDNLIGGAGSDKFAFKVAASSKNIDTLSDFTVSDDKIQLSKTVFKGFSAVGAISDTSFLSGAGKTSAMTTAQKLIYDSSSGKLYYDADGSGKIAAIQIALIGNKANLTSSSFEIIS
jgi:Ca2+-binding RTX toxin-like protein